MIRRSRCPSPASPRRRVRLALGLLGVLAGTAAARADSLPPAGPVEEAPPPRKVDPALVAQQPPVLTLATALRWAIEHNPGLATIRKQHGIAAAGIVIADTYPFNPIVQDFVMADNGPTAALVTNHVYNANSMRLDLELFHQGRHRRALAAATLTRTDWDIAAQEVLVGVQVIRAFNNVLYRQEQLRLRELALRLQEQVLEKVETLARQGVLPRTELMLARADVVEARTALGPARSLLTVAWNDFRRLLGMVDEECMVDGTLETPVPHVEAADLVLEAQQRRPDLRALEVAIKEADAALRLQIANRWGNPSAGPATEVNETSVYFIGMWLIWSPPVFNTRKGEILAAKATVSRAIQAARSLDTTIQQDVRAALKRLAAAQDLIQTYRTETFPTLQRQREAFDELFAKGEPGVTLARIIAIRTRLLAARSAYLDALFELSQAEADLAAAVGDPGLAVTLSSPPAPKDAKATR
jgi:cobalt-zinc-cadmium efflux system outer membrane protein